MRRKTLTTLITPFLLLPLSLHAQQHRALIQPDEPEKTNTLPVTRVSLYKNGVGFFEHTGHVTGNAAVTIDFTSGQLNDVLQSLTAIDLNGGRISGAGYNSTTPLAQQLSTLPLALDGSPTIAGFYSSIRGSRVEVRTGTTSITGRLLSVETGDTIASNNKPTEPEAPQKLLITVISDAGDVRTLAVTTNTTIRLLDPTLDANVTRYLKLLDANRSQGLRHLTLEDLGTGARELKVSYISEVPIWKSTYRILFTSTNPAGSSTNPRGSSTNPAGPSTNPAGPSTNPGGPSFASSAKGGVSSGTNPGTSGTTATLQGWSVVDNTTGTDWINVHLSLIAGAPQSFIQPLSQPIYSHRPEIAIAQEAQLTPQTFESGSAGGGFGSGVTGSVVDASGAVIPNASIIAINSATGARNSLNSDSNGRFSASLAAGNYRLEVSAPGFNRLVESNVNIDGNQMASLNLPLQVGSASQTVSVTADSVSLDSMNASIGMSIGGPMARKVPNSYHGLAAGAFGKSMAQPMMAAPPPPPPPAYEDLASASFTANTQSNAFDDFFAYNLADPVTIRKNESALVPILQAKVAAEQVTLVHSNGYQTTQPLRALWLTNSSDLTLDRGSFSIVEDGNFGGEGLLDPIHAGEKRLLSYAADQAVHVSTEGSTNTSKVARISAAKGVLSIQRAEHSQLTYVIRNAASAPRTIILETPVQPGYTLDSSLKPDETTPTVNRFRIQAAPGETVRETISASHRGFTTYQLTSTDENQFALILQQTDNNPKLVAAIQPILEARRKVAETDAAVDQTQTQLDNLHANEDRQRFNITALHQADKNAQNRFVNDLNHTEDQIIATQKELDTRTAAKESAEADLANRIEAFQLNETL